MCLDPKVHRQGSWKMTVNGKCSVNGCGLTLLCRGNVGFRYHCREKPGDQLMLSSLICTCVPNYASAQTKEASSKLCSEQTSKTISPRWLRLSTVPGLKERLSRKLDSTLHCGFKSKLWLPIYMERSEAFVVSCCVLVCLCFWFLGLSVEGCKWHVSLYPFILLCIRK